MKRLLSAAVICLLLFSQSYAAEKENEEIEACVRGRYPSAVIGEIQE